MSNKTLSEIIDEVKDGGQPEYEDLLYALLAMSALQYFSYSDLMKIKPGIAEFLLKVRQEEAFSAYRAALNKPPKEYVGWNNDPKNPEYQKFRRMGNKLIDKVIKKVEDEKNKEGSIL